jgi:hypothetical protein
MQQLLLSAEKNMMEQPVLLGLGYVIGVHQFGTNYIHCK